MGKEKSSHSHGLVKKTHEGASPSRYKAMWLFVMFDLPVGNKDERRRYTQFRKKLIGEGFQCLQFSVYARYFGSEEASAACRRRVVEKIPAAGRVRVLHVTERQFSTMAVFFGKRRDEPEEPPEQLLLF